jgi:ABC-type multidrug transport system fused ATPase/permease subunit
MESFFHILIFIVGFLIVVLTLFSALSTFVLPRAARSQLNRIVFGLLRRVFDFILHFAKTYERRDAIMAYYAPVGLMLLLPTWYLLISLGFAAMYWGAGAGDSFIVLQLSGSSLFTLGFATENVLLVTILEFIEAMLGLILVALLIAYLPTIYAAFSRREQAVNMLEVRAGSPPSASEMLMRFNRIHGLDKLADYWKIWEAWFADIEESHTTLPALVFFRSPRAENSWVTAAGTVLDSASITLSALDIPYEASAALCIRSGFLAFRRIANYFDIPNPQNPHHPEIPICVTREEFDSVLDQLEAAGLPLKADREQAWVDFAGWRVNYDRSLILLCGLVMAPQATWSSDRMPEFHLPPLMISKKKKHMIDSGEI